MKNKTPSANDQIMQFISEQAPARAQRLTTSPVRQTARTAERTNGRAFRAQRNALRAQSARHQLQDGVSAFYSGH
tara:strand:+ start:965 stop:1189 length:225 start_codon:yes stop_codon:yes gene_type:complete